MPKTKKIIITAFFAAVMIVAVSYRAGSDISTASKIDVQNGEYKESLVVYQKITTPDEPEARFEELSIQKGASALDIINQSSKIQVQGEEEQAFVTAIDGIFASEGNREFWAFYVNGEKADVGAGSYKLNGGDKIEWRIETY